MRKRYDVCIIGGGITGLIAAYGLVKKGKSVIVFEKEPFLGGVILPLDINGYSIEGFYHHIFKNDRHLLPLLSELGIRPTWHTVTTAFCYPGIGTYGLSSPLDLLRFRRLKTGDRLRFIRLLMLIRSIKETSGYARFLAKDWIIEKAGEAVYTKVFEPLIQAKFGRYSPEIGADWLIERLRMRAHRNLSGEVLGYIPGGFRVLIQTLAEKIRGNGGAIAAGRTVEKILTSDRGCDGVLVAPGEMVYSNWVINTAPPENLLRMIRFEGEYASGLRRLEYLWSICVLLGMKRRLTGHYWTNVLGREMPFNAVIEHTNFQDLSAYGEHIVYLASYPDKDSTVWSMDDGAVLERYLEPLDGLFPGFGRKDVNWARVVRSEETGLVYRKGIRDLIPSARSSVKGLLMAGMFNAYPERSIDIMCSLAKKCVDLII